MGYITHIVYYDKWLTTQLRKFIDSYDMAMWCSYDTCKIFKEDHTIVSSKQMQKAFRITIFTKSYPDTFLTSVTSQFSKYSCIYSYKLPKMAYQAGMDTCSK